MIFHLTGAPNHIHSSRGQAHHCHAVTARGLILAHRTIGPAGNVKTFPRRMEQNAVGSAAGFDPGNHQARLRVYNHNRIAEKVGGIEQTAIGRKLNIADEVFPRPCFFGNDGKHAGRFQCAGGEGKFVDRGARSATRVNLVTSFGNSQAEPALGYRRPVQFFGRSQIDDADSWRLRTAIQNQQILAVAGCHRRNGKRPDGNLLPCQNCGQHC